MVIKQGEIWWASLGEPRGSEPGFIRPVVIIQSDDFNKSRLNTVVVVIITSNIWLAEAPGNVVLSQKQSGLPKKSVVNVSQIKTVDKVYLRERVKQLPQDSMAKIEAGIRLVLSLV